MSGKKRDSGSRKGQADNRTDHLAELLEQEATVSNAEFEQSMIRGAGASDTGPEVSILRDVALPMLEHTMLALQITEPDQVALGRFREILQRSELGRDSVAELSAILDLKQAAAITVQRAMEECFGQDSEIVRGEIWTSLRDSWEALSTGDVSEDKGHWVVSEEQRIALTSLEDSASTTDRAYCLLRDLTTQFTSSAIREKASAQDTESAPVHQLVRRLYLAVAFDEEEEEEVVAGFPELDL